MQQILPLILVILLSLTGCQKQTETQDTVKDTVVVETESKETSAIKSKEDFIVETFQTYGFDVSEQEDLIIKEEGERTVVIIKEIRKNQRPNISKMIFKWNETNPELYFVMVNNNPVFGKES
ncbi:MAG: hypothetical protein RR565_06840 [Erysipelothrix sp.]